MSLAERFSKLANTTPVFQDPEDDVNTETVAQVVDPFQSEEVDDFSSHLRQKTVQLLSDVDARYSGKKISRAHWRDENENYEDDDESSEEEDDNITAFKNQFQKTSKLIKKSEIDEESEDKEEDESEEDEDESDVESVDEKDDSEEEKDGSEEDESDNDNSVSTGHEVIQNFSKIDISKEMDKGKAVQAQLGLWDKLLEVRIKLQKMLVVANRLPHQETWSLFQSLGGTELIEPLTAGRKSMKSLLGKLIELQEELLDRNPETRHVLDETVATKSKNKTSKNDDDEEIPSDTDQEMDEEDKPTAQRVTKKKLKRKFSDFEYPEILAKRHQNFTTFRNDTIQRWNERTRIASGKLNQKSFAAFEQSAIKQIEQILVDKERLRKRTQLKRTVYRVLGKPENNLDVDEAEAKSRRESFPKADEHLKDYDSEIFDDSDFYHQLLRELIERKTADVNDPVALSRQWIEIQKLRGKIKRKIDTKASKGRKIRFDVLPKLINFMAPVDSIEYTEEARNELFGSLFGQRTYSAS